MLTRMRTGPHRAAGRLWRALSLALLLATLLHTGGGLAAAAQDGEAPLDLAAMVLTPADLAAEGLEGYGANEGFTWTTLDDAERGRGVTYSVDSRGRINLGGIAGAIGLLDETDWRRIHELRLALPAEPGSTDIGDTVWSGIEEFADADGAAEAFAFFAQKRRISNAVEEIEGTATLGEQSALWRLSGVSLTVGSTRG